MRVVWEKVRESQSPRPHPGGVSYGYFSYAFSAGTVRCETDMVPRPFLAGGYVEQLAEKRSLAYPCQEK